jgi:mono/diheme cytochrome c family protein
MANNEQRTTNDERRTRNGKERSMLATTNKIFSLCLILAASASACKKDGGGASSANIPAESRDIFAQRCVACHGADGSGNGPASAALTPKPRNFSDASWQSGTSDDLIRTIILNGGQAVGKSPLMPPNPDLQAKPDVVNGLVAIVRGFGSH